MNRSRNPRDLLPEHSALQHERAAEHAPRPLPLFLELVRQVSERDPDAARASLTGLRAYQAAERHPAPPPRPEIARVRGACLRDHGGGGPPAVLIPSLINPPRILDLDLDVSLTAAVANMGRRVLLLDWGPADKRCELSVAAHIDQLLLPLLRSIAKPAALIGYCLGGTMAIAAAGLIESERVATLAAPWRFACYPAASRNALAAMWQGAQIASRSLGALPMEVLQAAFWSLDPERTVRKFAEFGRLAPDSAEARRFVSLEDWANEGEALPYPAARELIEDLFGRDRPGSGDWIVGGRTASEDLGVPALHLLAGKDRIAPPETAPAGPRATIASGHVGMIVGSARSELRERLSRFLDPACR
ncbi:MAG TPA: alpha/beta hydrolase [Sphingopyxis sp.]|nr:alpha/beta hydrolase [Sphingopyxis sp.]